jgi:hypothetical protein
MPASANTCISCIQIAGSPLRPRDERFTGQRSNNYSNSNVHMYISHVPNMNHLLLLLLPWLMYQMMLAQRLCGSPLRLQDFFAEPSQVRGQPARPGRAAGQLSCSCALCNAGATGTEPDLEDLWSSIPTRFDLFLRSAPWKLMICQVTAGTDPPRCS